MADSDKYRRCAKCGVCANEEPLLTFHRFPFGKRASTLLKLRVWAEYCFPERDWTSEEELLNLRKQHKVLCCKHFGDSSFTDSSKKQLNNFAIPIDAHAILQQLRDNVQVSESIAVELVPSTSATSANPTTSAFAQAATSQTPKKSRGILAQLDIHKASQMSPKKLKLYKVFRQKLSEIARLRQKNKNVRKDIQACTILNNLVMDENVNNLINRKISSSFALLLQSQLQNTPRKLRGRRWSIDDKVMALSLYKRSSTCYRLLRRLFCLPSESTLRGLLNKVPMDCGLNNQILETIQEIAKNRNTDENLCILSFDEMSIRKNFYYNKKTDRIYGFQDHATQGRTREVASHALVFMVIGIRKKWKQPVAFYFSGDSVTADRLTVLVKEVIGACFQFGLNICGTVCDLDGVNIKTLNSLGSTRDKPYFEFQGHEIVTILDPPHLLKCFRNMFMKYDVECIQEVNIGGKPIKGVAKWSHIEEFFKIDNINPNFVFAPALTNQHINPNGKQKMKVSLAAQVLSHSVAAGILAKISLGGLPQEATATAMIVNKMDQLFDCMNGETPDYKKGKKFLTNMSKNSPHHSYFKEMKQFFKDIKFIGSRGTPPSQDGWIRTINAMEQLYLNLSRRCINSLSTRRLNQDPLENCFGCIRNNCGSNANPNAMQFIAAFKTSIISNLLITGKGTNCEIDNYEILSNLKAFISYRVEVESVNIVMSEINVNELSDACTSLEDSSEMQACTYVSGYILKKLTITCELCKLLMYANTEEPQHLFVTFKEYTADKQSLIYASENLCKSVELCATTINMFLKDNAHCTDLREKIKILLKNSVDFGWLNLCSEHFEKNLNHIIYTTFIICIHRHCVLKNREFIEEASRRALKRKIDVLKHT